MGGGWGGEHEVREHERNGSNHGGSRRWCMQWKETECEKWRGRKGERERERVGGYIKTGAGACQVLRCTQCISVRHRGTPASRKSKYKRVHRRLLLKRKKGARLQNARSRSCPTGKCSCTLIRSNDRCAYVPFGHRATVYPRSACHRQPRN